MVYTIMAPLSSWFLVVIVAGSSTSSAEELVYSTRNAAGLVSAVRRHLQSSSVFLLDCSTGDVDTIFPSMIKATSAMNLPATLMNVQNIFSINDTTPALQGKPLYVILSGDNIMKLFTQKIFKAGQKKRISWLWLLHQVVLDLFFEGATIPFSSELLVAQTNLSAEVRVTRVYRVTEDRPLIGEPYGTWTPGTGALRPDSWAGRLKTDFQGVTIKTAVLDVKEITQLITVGGETMVVGGYFGEVWHLLEKKLNFTSEYIRVGGQSVGSLLANGTWTGMMKLLAVGSVQVGLTRAYITPRRKEVVDFTRPLIFVRQNIFIKIPEYNNVFSLKKYFLPFSRMLWMTIGLIVLGMSAVIYIVNWMTYKYGIQGYSGQCLHDFSVAVFIVFGVFCTQDCMPMKTSNSCKLVVFSASCTSMVVLAAYSGSVISQLTVMDEQLPFTDLRGLISHGSYRLGVVKNSGLVDLFNNKANSKLYEVYIKVMRPIQNNFPQSVKDGLKKVCKEKNFAFMADLDVAVSYMKNLSCNLAVLPDFSIMSSMSLLMAPNSPYKEAIDYSLTKMQDAGILHRLYYKYFPKEMPHVPASQKSVGFFVVLPIFLLLCAGICISLVLLVSEIYTSIVVTKFKL